MYQYDDRIIERLVSLSDAKTMPEAFHEWEPLRYRSRQPSRVCGLCDVKEFRHSHQIKNKVNGNRLVIGSKCFSNFWGPNARVPVPTPVLDLDVD